MKEQTIAGLTCSQVLSMLSDYVDGELESASTSRVEQHLVQCSNCDRFGKSFGAMVVSLRGRPAPEGPVDSAWLVDLLKRIDELNAES